MVLLFALLLTAVSLLFLSTPSWNTPQSHERITPATLLVAVPPDPPVTPSSSLKNVSIWPPILPSFMMPANTLGVFTIYIHDPWPYHHSSFTSSTLLSSFSFQTPKLQLALQANPSYIFPVNPNPENLNPTLTILGLDPKSLTQLEKQNKQQRMKLPGSTLNIWFKKIQKGFPHDDSTVLYFGNQ